MGVESGEEGERRREVFGLATYGVRLLALLRGAPRDRVLGGRACLAIHREKCRLLADMGSIVSIQKISSVYPLYHSCIHTDTDEYRYP